MKKKKRKDRRIRSNKGSPGKVVVFVAFGPPLHRGGSFAKNFSLASSE